MNKILNCLIILIVSVIGTGCSQKKPEIGLTRDKFSHLEASKVSKVNILTAAYTPSGFPYQYYFSIIDPEKISTIIECIRDAKQTDEKYESDLKRNSRLIFFETQKAIYFSRIAWNDKSVHGNWDTLAVEDWSWESAKLREHFRQWDIIEDIAAADPNWPDPKWMTTPPPESDPNFPPNKVPWARHSLLNMNTAFTEETFSILDTAKVIEVCLLVPLPKEKTMHVVPIEDTEKIKTIVDCIQNDEAFCRDAQRTCDNTLYFVVGRRLFSIRIGWNEDAVYGNWWKSEELYRYFKEWNVFPPTKTIPNPDSEKK